jgi:hydroxymethylbilane synthase
LALKQVEEIRALLPGLDFETVTISTSGDKDKNTPLSEMEGTDFFTRQIEDALLSGKIDFAVHSAKDMPDKLRNGLAIAAITRSADPYDALVSKGGLKIHELRQGARVGASSSRRKSQLKSYRSDLQIVDIRGNVGDRIDALNKKDLDAVVIAAAGLMRLGLEGMIAQKIPKDIMEPHPLQGRLAIQIKHNRKDLIEIFRRIDAD